MSSVVRSQASRSMACLLVAPAEEAPPAAAPLVAASPSTGRPSASRGAQYALLIGAEPSVSMKTSSSLRCKPRLRNEGHSFPLLDCCKWKLLDLTIA